MVIHYEEAPTENGYGRRYTFEMCNGKFLFTTVSFGPGGERVERAALTAREVITALKLRPPYECPEGDVDVAG